MKKGPIIFVIALSFLLSIATAVVLYIYQEDRIRQIESSLEQLEASMEKLDSDESAPEFTDAAIVFDETTVYFDPGETTYHSSKECPQIKYCDELAFAKCWEVERNTDLFPCAICIH